MRSAYLYVDGESHYCMSEKCLKNNHGSHVVLGSANPTGTFWHHTESKFFWDEQVTGLANIRFSNIDRSVYFTAFTGTPENLQDARVLIREAGFEPQVLLELKDSEKQRASRLKNDRILIKAKGVDTKLSVRMLEDAYHGNFQVCLLFTSDIDYLPVIEAVRRMGKTVIVFGFQEGIANDSPFLYVPERFIDISVQFKMYSIKDA